MVQRATSPTLFSLLPYALGSGYLSTSPAQGVSNFSFSQHRFTELTKHQIHGTDDRHSVSQQVALGDVIESTQVSKAWSTNGTPVWPLAAITDDVNTHLALGGLNSRVSLSRRY